ncbi:MAG: 1-acyl-sn-glycerol-3-phosphate acyltransferase [Burkholderiaceae bacterium]|jgi:1-acyl-sn-glycerol-3-phosphate acyltransferase|nr:1-acyl-sn-glycerol-3-phosphate acyltransferase [Burkholderiaceae bacterium]
MMNRYWRVAGTGFCFALFAVGGLLLPVLVFPALRLLARDREQYVRFSRRTVRYSFIAFIRIMCMVGVLKYTYSGLERLQRRGLLIVSNHPTLIDTIFLVAAIDCADCIVKEALWLNPFTRGPVRAANYIRNDRDIEVVNNCILSLQRGDNLIIFPEGTRTPPDGVVRLKRGAANVAIRGRKNVTPVTIRCTPTTLGKHTRWWEIPERSVHFHIAVHEDIDIVQFKDAYPDTTLSVRRLNHYMQDYFNQGRFV